MRVLLSNDEVKFTLRPSSQYSSSRAASTRITDTSAARLRTVCRKVKVMSRYNAALGKHKFSHLLIEIIRFLPIYPTCPSSPRRTRRRFRRVPTAARDRRESSHRLRLNSTFFTLYDMKLRQGIILEALYQFKATNRLKRHII